MRPDELDTQEIQPAQARLILALVLSLALHLALAFLVRVMPATPTQTQVKVLQVDFAERRFVAPSQAVEVPPSLPVQEPERPAPPVGLPNQIPEPPAMPVISLPPPQSPPPAVEIPLVEDPTYYTARQVDVHPAAVEPVNPVFPDTAAEGGVEGYVTLRLLLDDGGVVREISVADAQPPDTFEAAALSAFRNARFSPALRNGRPVKSEVLIKVTFELVNRGGK